MSTIKDLVQWIINLEMENKQLKALLEQKASKDELQGVDSSRV